MRVDLNFSTEQKHKLGDQTNTQKFRGLIGDLATWDMRFSRVEVVFTENLDTIIARYYKNLEGVEVYCVRRTSTWGSEYFIVETDFLVPYEVVYAVEIAARAKL